MRRSQLEVADVAGGMEEMRANYEAARATRFRRRRTGLLLTGSSADFHYRNVYDYLKMMEYARDMDRNDAIIGASIDKAVRNTIQNGMGLDPKTGIPAANQEIKERWEAWSSDRLQCDISGQHNFTEIEEFTFRQMIVDGDNLVLPLDSGQLSFVEAHRMRTPTSTKRNVICGVLLSDRRKPLEYWITQDDIDPFAPLKMVGEVDKIPAWTTDEETGEEVPNAFHVWRGKRKSQTRGVTLLAPIFDLVGMHDDIQFAEVVKRQVASCFAIIRERATDWKPGGIDPYGNNWLNGVVDLNKRIVEELAPGHEVRGLPGEKITGFTPNIPGEGFFDHMRMILQIIFNNLGLPLVMGLMDASDTNFSGWRGAVDEARRGFSRNQQWLIERFHTPCYRWKLRQFLRVSPTLRAAYKKLGPKFFNHQWNAPRWPYIQPLQDAQADTTRMSGLLTSPRRIQNEKAADWDEIIEETIEDNGNAILKSIMRAKEIAQQTGEPVKWREVLFLTNADLSGVKAAAGAGGGAGKPAGEPGAEGGKPGEKPGGPAADPDAQADEKQETPDPDDAKD